jgi:hypothetical protein
VTNLHYRLQVIIWIAVFTLPALLLLAVGFTLALLDIDHMFERRIPNLSQKGIQ